MEISYFCTLRNANYLVKPLIINKMNTNPEKELWEEEDYYPPIPHTLEELNAALDVAERQFEEGKYVPHEVVKRWIRERIAKARQSMSEGKEELYEMPIAV